jgi:hypothetical protein
MTVFRKDFWFISSCVSYFMHLFPLALLGKNVIKTKGQQKLHGFTLWVQQDLGLM